MVHRAMNCRATSICITDYIILFDNPIAAIFRNDPSCFAGSRMSLASCEPHSSETSNQLIGFINPPALADRTLVLAKRLFEQWHQFDNSEPWQCPERASFVASVSISSSGHGGFRRP